MKTKTLLLLFLLLGIGFSSLSGQTLKKGSVVVYNTYTSVLNPDVTMNQFLDFYMNKFIPEFEKNHPGVKIIVLSGDRGEKKNQIGEIVVFESVAVRDKYWPTDSTESDVAKAATEKMKSINEEMSKYFLPGGSRVYTDWVVK